VAAYKVDHTLSIPSDSQKALTVTETIECVAVEPLLHRTAQSEARHFWFRGLRAFVKPLLERATAECSSARILDCGCGTGANLELLGGFGRAYGFDLSEAGLRAGRKTGRTRTVRASVTAAPFPSQAFDVVTSLDVLYALDPPSERQALAEMYRLLKPGGFAIINVAAVDALRGDHSILSHELRRYRPRELRARLVEAGFIVVRLTYTYFTIFLPLLALRTFQRTRGLKREQEAGREISVPGEPANAILSGLMRLESLWLRFMDEPIGSSLLCLARKPVEART
jgi:SAM-dependent methyltransferase